MDELEPFLDDLGNIRRCGSLPNEEGAVSAFPDYSSILVPYNDDQIKVLLASDKRVPSRVTFDKKWTQNQRSHGSCNGYLTAQLLAKSRYLRGITDGTLFSGSYPYSKMNGGRDAGSNVERGMHVICENGSPPEALCPWDQIYPNQQAKGIDAEAAKNKGFNPIRTADFQQVRTALSQQIPVGIVVQFGRNFQRFNAQGIGGIDNGPGNHALVADDLVVIQGREYIDIHNEHGNEFGPFGNGRGYYPIEVLRETIRSHFFYILMSTVSA